MVKIVQLPMGSNPKILPVHNPKKVFALDSRCGDVIYEVNVESKTISRKIFDERYLWNVKDLVRVGVDDSCTCPSFFALSGAGAMRVSSKQEKDPISMIGKQYSAVSDFTFCVTSEAGDLVMATRHGSLRMCRRGRIDHGRSQLLAKETSDKLIALDVTKDTSLVLRAFKGHILITEVSSKNTRKLHLGVAKDLKHARFSLSPRIILGTTSNKVLVWKQKQGSESFSRRCVREFKANGEHLQVMHFSSSGKGYLALCHVNGFEVGELPLTSKSKARRLPDPANATTAGARYIYK